MNLFSRRLSLPLAAITALGQVAVINGQGIESLYEYFSRFPLEYKGEGRCRDANGHDYDSITFFGEITETRRLTEEDPQEYMPIEEIADNPYDWCFYICLVALGPGNHGRGLEVEAVSEFQVKCNCLFDDGALPTLPEELIELPYVSYEESQYGSGLVKGIDSEYDPEEGYRDCFKLWMDKYFEQVGPGSCLDKAGEDYERIQFEIMPEAAPVLCADRCHDSMTGGLHFRGFEVYWDDDAGEQGEQECACLFDKGEAPEELSDGGSYDGVGPVWGSALKEGGSSTTDLCYRTRMDNDYEYVGEGYCQDMSRNEYDFTVLELDPYDPPQACAELCLPSNIAAVDDTGSLENLRGFMFEEFSFVDEGPVRRLHERHLKNLPDDQQTRRLEEGNYCLCLYDDGVLEDLDIGVEVEHPYGEYGYLDFVHVETEYNGTEEIAYTMIPDEEEGYPWEYSCYKYLPNKYEVTIPGVISISGDICELDQEDKEVFIRAVIETLEMELDNSELNYGNDIVANLGVVIERFCGQSINSEIPDETPYTSPTVPATDAATDPATLATLPTQARKLQQDSTRTLQQASSSWQIEYTVAISNILCGSGGCTSFDDINGINALITSVSDTLQTNIQNGDFISELTSNAALQAAIDSEILACLVAWGSVYAASWGGINTNNAVQITQTQGTLDVNVTNQLEFYPDWSGGTGTCLNDGNEPLYMTKNPSTWLYSSLEDCCARYYPGWNEPECLHSTGTGLWYVDYTTLKCVTDCEKGVGGPTCGGLAPPDLDELYGNPRDCCEQQLQWVYSEFCEADSLTNECYVGTGKFYRGSDASEVCVRDCPEADDPTCGGVVDAAWVRLHDDASACCDEEFNWIDNDLCTARSENNVLEKYWADMTNGECIKDSVSQPEDLSVPMFDSPEDCCETVHWVNQDKCVAEADGLAYTYQGTEKYYVKSGECVKDCEAGSGTDCGGFATQFDPLSDSKTACCNESLWWLELDECL